MLTFTRYQKFVVALLALSQFTIILDFMILSPLGAFLMPALKISPAQFGFVVSVYAFSAGASGLLAAGFADRYDRKKLLLFFYIGFTIGTLLCALATDYHFLLAARMITGIFGGVIGSVVFAIITDLFPMEMRGRVMGYVQTAFASSQILGIPIGLFLSNHWGWHSAFMMIVVVCLGVIASIWFFLKPIDEHLKIQNHRNPFQHLVDTISKPRYVHAFATMALLSTGGFMMMPFGSAFNVKNLHIQIEQLPLIYMVTGICSMITGPIVGRLSDTYGKFKLFTFGSVLSIAMVLAYTQLVGPTSILTVTLLSTIMFIGISSRIITAQALVSGIPEPSMRGSFMSVSSSIQQISGGLAAILAGLIVHENTNGTLDHFDTLGYIVTLALVITIAMIAILVQWTNDRPAVPAAS
ncbi:MFS transporter [bacterium]|nr:MFS transporter [bacterium]